MLNTLRNRLVTNIKAIPGWRTNRHIVVFESDDWGSIRMPSRAVYNKCLNSGYRVDQNIFSKYDSLASEDDLSLLFDVLTKFRDINGKHPVITANCLTSNPDFDKIKEYNFESYHYECITKTFSRYPRHNKCWDLWQKGIESGLFYPQFHGREHLNVSRFMRDLKDKNPDTLFAFENSMPGIFAKENVKEGNNYVVALEYFNDTDKLEKELIIQDGLALFQQFFKYPSESFIATNYIWHNGLNKLLAEKGVKYFQGSQFQLSPKGEYKGFKKKFHYLGETNKQGQIYLTRNAYFEPTLNRNNDWVSSCMKQIEIAFKWNKPAIISTHRINYVGFIDESNRDTNLVTLTQLINTMLLKYPDIVFMTSDQLGAEIGNTKNKPA